MLPTDSEVVAVVGAIRSGDVEALRRLLADNPGLANERLGSFAKGRTPLHVGSDWPGYFANGGRAAE